MNEDCMGGFRCSLRDKCARYKPGSGMPAAERLCPPGEDGVIGGSVGFVESWRELKALSSKVQAQRISVWNLNHDR